LAEAIHGNLAKLFFAALSAIPPRGFGVNHNYFRSLPTYDPRLLGTGLLGPVSLSRLQRGCARRTRQALGVYASLGRSKATSDKKNSLNQSFGLTVPNLWKSGLMADVHYSKFDSSFGSGKYTSFTFERTLPIFVPTSVLGRSSDVQFQF